MGEQDLFMNIKIDFHRKSAIFKGSTDGLNGLVSRKDHIK